MLVVLEVHDAASICGCAIGIHGSITISNEFCNVRSTRSGWCTVGTASSSGITPLAATPLVALVLSTATAPVAVKVSCSLLVGKAIVVLESLKVGALVLV